MRISDWSSDVCSSDLQSGGQIDSPLGHDRNDQIAVHRLHDQIDDDGIESRIHSCRKADEHNEHARNNRADIGKEGQYAGQHTQKRCHRHARSEEHTSELQSLMRISYAVFCLKKKKKENTNEQQKTK